MPEIYRVVIVGGGVGGLSAAHELAARSTKKVGYDIAVYDRHQCIPGGKARSIPVPGSGTGGRPDLPGEHGFRFFPGFYRHLPETMESIPVGGGRFASDNLVDTTRLLIGRAGCEPFVAPSRFPRSLSDFKQVLEDYFDFSSTGLTKDDVEFFAGKLWQVATSCWARQVDEFERIAWWDFIEADTRSKAFQDFLGNGLSRSLTANNPHKASTRTLGNIYLQLIYGIMEPGGATDRVLNAPTNDAWINPWVKHLQEQGVHYHLDSECISFSCENRRISTVTFKTPDGTVDVTGDYFIFALPVERMARLLISCGKQSGLYEIDPTLRTIVTLQRDVDWMNGLMYYLNADVPIVNGHQLYVDSPWAITGISQTQFWNNYDLAAHGNGKVRSILSTDISNWHAPGILYNKAAMDCTKEQIKNEVWEQIKRCLNVGGKTVLSDDMIESWFLDPDITAIKASAESQAKNAHALNQETTHIHTDTEPLLVNLANRWDLRPEAYTRVPNLFLAADYVKTYSDLACMEAANEAARRAVNSLLRSTGSNASLCKVYQLHVPLLFEFYRTHDETRYEQGLPWDGTLLS